MSRSRPIDKELFAAGLQCAKRLYLDFHHPEKIPSRGELREQLVEVGQQLLTYARQAFPRGIEIVGDDVAIRIKNTAAALAEGKPTVLFEACFRHEDLQIQTDILLNSGTGVVDLYEVKAGTRIKPRHVMDLAFQLYVLEKCGFKVRSTSILHVNPQYRHQTDDPRATQQYPAQQLFKNSDVTGRVRRLLPKVESQLMGFRSVMSDDATLGLPTGTWCKAPIECHYFAMCTAEGPDFPLVELPDLSRQQEHGFHEQAVESLIQIDPKQSGLTLTQRRAVRAVQEDLTICEPQVKLDLVGRPTPLHFVSFHCLLQVMPIFDGTRPWQHIPFLWSVHTLRKDGTLDKTGYCGDGLKDPRPEFVERLTSILRGPGTVVVYNPDFGERLREMLEDQVEPKSEIRSMLALDVHDLQRTLRIGVYAAGLRGSFALQRAMEVFGVAPAPTDGITEDTAAGQAFLRLVNPRTRPQTRTKIIAALQAYAETCSKGMHDLWQTLQQTRQGPGGE